LLSSFGNKKLNELTKHDFQKAYNLMSARGLSPRTVYTLHVAAMSVITWAMDKRFMSEGVLKGITLPKIPKTRPEFLTYEETQAFLEVAPTYWYGNAFKFQLLAGLRNQELLALMWEDINFESSTILIRRACIWARGFNGFKSTKTNEERTLALDPQTVTFLNRLKAIQEEHIKSRKNQGLPYGDKRLVFCTQSGHVPDASTVRYCFKNILKKSVLPGGSGGMV
jgi:integrase